MENEWDFDTEMILENLRINANNMAHYHKDRYYHYKGLLKYFKIPIIVLSSITSVASVGLSTYLAQESVSLFTCLMSLFSAIIGSIELYLGIQTSMEISLDVSKQYQILAYDIYKTLNLKREHRNYEGKIYLEEKFKDYIKITENAILVLNNKIPDALAPIPEEFKIKKSSSITKLLKTPPKVNKDIELGMISSGDSDISNNNSVFSHLET